MAVFSVKCSAVSSWPGRADWLWSAVSGLIHIDDMVNGILWLLDNELRGHLIWFRPTRYAMNNLPMRSACAASPGHFARPRDRHSTVNGESSVLVLGGQRALPKRLEERVLRFAGTI